MIFLRPLLAIAIAATTAAIGAGPASAAALEVRNEANNNHCPAVTRTGTDVNGGCLIHVKGEKFDQTLGEAELRKHVFGVESHITKCHIEFWMRLDEDASGYILEQQLSGPSCTRQACEEEVESHPWPASGSEPSAGKRILTTNICVEELDHSPDETCEIEVPFINDLANHVTEFGQLAEIPAHGISGFRCEIVAHWQTEASGTVSHDGEYPVNVTVAHV